MNEKVKAGILLCDKNLPVFRMIEIPFELAGKEATKENSSHSKV